MMGKMTREDEFAEFETDEASFDVMMARGEPAEIVSVPARSTVVVSRAGWSATVTMPASPILSVLPPPSLPNGGAAPRHTSSGRLSIHCHRSHTESSTLAS